MPAPSKEIKQPKPLPAPNSDFYELAETLPAEELLQYLHVALDARHDSPRFVAVEKGEGEADEPPEHRAGSYSSGAARPP